MEQNLNVPVSFCFVIVAASNIVCPNKFEPDVTYFKEFGFIVSCLSGGICCEKNSKTHTENQDL